MPCTGPGAEDTMRRVNPIPAVAATGTLTMADQLKLVAFLIRTFSVCSDWSGLCHSDGYFFFFLVMVIFNATSGPWPCCKWAGTDVNQYSY